MKGTSLIAGAAILLSASVRPMWPSEVGPKIRKNANVSVNKRDGAGLVFVPGGLFEMGTSDAADGSRFAAPTHRVSVSSFWIYRCEVSTAQYARFARETKRSMPPLPHYWRPSWPITRVSWEDASRYAAWAGGTLPTEAQWERAARGSDGRNYTWGNQFESTLVYSSAFPKPTVVVEELPKPGPYGLQNVTIRCPIDVDSLEVGASPYGAIQMLGNVAEWCLDEFDPVSYLRLPQVEPFCSRGDPLWAGFHAVRGGSYGEREPRRRLTTVARSASRTGAEDLGFRLVIRRTGEPPAGR